MSTRNITFCVEHLSQGKDILLDRKIIVIKYTGNHAALKYIAFEQIHLCDQFL